MTKPTHKPYPGLPEKPFVLDEVTTWDRRHIARGDPVEVRVFEKGGEHWYPATVESRQPASIAVVLADFRRLVVRQEDWRYAR